MGGPIASPLQVFSMTWRMMGSGPGSRWDTWKRGASGMFGAIEVAHVRGPVFVDHPYRVQGVAVGVGESPRTEYCLWDATVEDEDGQLVATVRILERVLKTTSALYPELAEASTPS